MAEVIEIGPSDVLPKGRPLLLIQFGDGLSPLGSDIYSITLPANATNEQVRQAIQEVKETAESEGRTICVVRGAKAI
jgi:hypothetical protein